jgi:metal-dependent amidase/aminoacylase/carboxypeptidase family protein
MPIRNRIADLHDEVTGWRRDMHKNPELMFETHQTSAFIAGKLREFGCDEVVTGIGRTGVVAVIKGKTKRGMSYLQELSWLGAPQMMETFLSEETKMARLASSI